MEEWKMLILQAHGLALKFPEASSKDGR
jgi:hypothetical protein